jgi:hypothetical protein
MANRTIYTRAYSTTSDAQLASRKEPTGHPLSNDELLAEFRNHANKGNQTPTALVSVSNRIIDTIHRAFQMHHGDGESPAKIWVVFIEAPSARDGSLNKTPARIHHARDLATRCQSRVAREYQQCPWCLKQQLHEEYERLEPVLFHYEFVFEGAIPEHYVLHKVSLQTLMSRGFQIQAPSTEDLRVAMAKKLEKTCSFEIGLNLGFWARKFGARAPMNWIAHQFYYDCVRTRIHWSSQMVDLDYAHGPSMTVDFDFFCELDRGVSTALMD